MSVMTNPQAIFAGEDFGALSVEELWHRHLELNIDYLSIMRLIAGWATWQVAAAQGNPDANPRDLGGVTAKLRVVSQIFAQRTGIKIKPVLL